MTARIGSKIVLVMASLSRVSILSLIGLFSIVVIRTQGQSEASLFVVTHDLYWIFVVEYVR